MQTAACTILGKEVEALFWWRNNNIEKFFWSEIKEQVSYLSRKSMPRILSLTPVYCLTSWAAEDREAAASNVLILCSSSAHPLSRLFGTGAGGYQQKFFLKNFSMCFSKLLKRMLIILILIWNNAQYIEHFQKSSLYKSWLAMSEQEW